MRRSERDHGDDVVSRARDVIPGGAQTGLRAQAYDLGDLAFESADGATLHTVDGRELSDYHLAFGPIVLGHGDDAVDRAVHDAVDRGALFGAATSPLELHVAEGLVDHLPSVEMVNFCNSGSEATYHAIRLARAHTGNETVLKFEGCYHGWHDYVDVSVYPPAEAVGETHVESAGTLDAAVDATVVEPFNDVDALERRFREDGDDLAAVIVEPVPHSVGCLQPDQAFLDALETRCAEAGVPLIFDEVITAFRHAPEGAQGLFDVDPDLTCVAKALGNGYPVAAVGGKAHLLSQAGGSNTDGVVISGTYSGHQVGLAAAAATLEAIESRDVTDHLTELGAAYRQGLSDLLADHGIDGRVVGYRSIFSPQFGVEGRPTRYEDVLGLDEAQFRTFAAGMRDRGQFVSPNPYKRHHLSGAHTEADLERYLAAADEVLAGMDASATHD